MKKQLTGLAVVTALGVGGAIAYGVAQDDSPSQQSTQIVAPGDTGAASGLDQLDELTRTAVTRAVGYIADRTGVQPPTVEIFRDVTRQEALTASNAGEVLTDPGAEVVVLHFNGDFGFTPIRSPDGGRVIPTRSFTFLINPRNGELLDMGTNETERDLSKSLGEPMRIVL